MDEGIKSLLGILFMLLSLLIYFRGVYYVYKHRNINQAAFAMIFPFYSLIVYFSEKSKAGE